MKLFELSKWIWKEKETSANEYVEFVGEFSCGQIEKVTLNLSFDSVCNVYVNGELVFLKKCSDYPYYKIYDEIDITKYCKEQNEIKFCVWHMGCDTHSNYDSNAGLIFEITQAENVLLSSNEDISCRQDIRYKNGEIKKITGQLGYSFYFDNTIENNLPYQKSVVVEKTKELHKNPLKELQLLEKTPLTILRQDINSILVDIGKEETGFLSLDIESEEEQELLITYGEHIVDGKVRQLINGRDFSVQIKLKKGKNNYTNYFRRLAGRYIEIFYNKEIKVNYVGLIPVIYPTTKKPFTAKTELQQRIYDTSVRTLQLSMHEHYEDCPWREQAMYVLDSKNQMLCGYNAFENGNYEYARHQLVLMSKGIKNDGLLELTYPAKDTPAIPFFSIMYPVTVKEYVEYSKDTSILKEVMPVIERIKQAFTNRIDETNLIPTLEYPYWNFYEWSLGSDRESEITRTKDEPYIKDYDLILNCAYVLSMEAIDYLNNTKGDYTKTRQAIYNAFYKKEKGLFALSKTSKELYSELGNSFAVLSNVVSKEESKEIIKQLQRKSEMIEATLSMVGFKYDAILKEDSKNIDYVIKDIEKNYGYMLEQNATSFWETIKGEADFDGAGSLCHGWSAMPVYYQTRKSCENVSLLQMKMFDRIEKYIQEKVLVEKQAPCFGVDIKKKGTTLFSKCYGFSNLEKKKQYTKNDLLFMYSMTKPITIVVCMLLIEQGKLKLSDYVERYLPEFSNVFLLVNGKKSVPKNKMTIEHLLTMTAGLSYDTNTENIKNAIAKKNATTREIVSSFVLEPLLFNPGERFNYSLCLDVMGAICEIIENKPFSKIVEDLIFKTLEMNNSFFHIPKEYKNSLVEQYFYNNGKYELLPNENYLIFTEKYDSAGAGLISTLSDYSKFADCIANCGVASNGYRLLKNETINEIKKPRVTTNESGGKFTCIQGDDYAYGLGVRTRVIPTKHTPVGEFGWDGMAGSYVFMDNETGLSMTMTMSVINWNNGLENICKDIREIAYEFYGEKNGKNRI